MPGTRPTYTATFERAENGTWVAALVEGPSVYGYGDSLVEARRNIRDAITTLFGPFEADAKGFELVEDIRLPESALAVVRRAHRQRERGNEQRTEARVADEAGAEATLRALAATRQAADLLMEQARLMNAEAEDFGLAGDVRLPEVVVLAVDRAHRERQTARRQRELAVAAQEAAAASSSEAIAGNREAARLLVDECGLTVEAAAGLLGLSTQRTRWLLTD